MKIEYDEQHDTLHLEFTKEAIVKDVSHGWNVNVGYGAKGVVEITIHDAKADGYPQLDQRNNWREGMASLDGGARAMREGDIRYRPDSQCWIFRFGE